MNNLTPVDGNLPKFLSKRRPSGSLEAARQGVQGAFAVVTYRGKNWRTKYRGDEELIRDARGQPVQSLEVVIVGVAESISKIYYQKGYTEGDDNAPDCFSLDGITPDAAAPKKQSSVCGTCPQNQFGSRMTPQGKRAKACSDSRRIAVVPLGDIMNEQLGGPMLLRLPPTTLPNFARYADMLERKGASDIWWVATRLSFDLDLAYPRIVFEPIAFVSEAQDAQIAELQKNPLLNRILYDAGPTELAPAAAADAEGAIPGTPPRSVQKTGATVTPLPRRAQQTPTPPEPTPEPEPEPEEEDEPAPPPPAAAKPTPFQGATRPRRAPQLQPEPAAAPAGLESAIDDLLDQPA